MHSTIADLGIWAASMSGNALLSDELAAARLETHLLEVGSPFQYGLGIIELFGEWGHGAR